MKKVPFFHSFTSKLSSWKYRSKPPEWPSVGSQFQTNGLPHSMQRSSKVENSYFDSLLETQNIESMVLYEALQLGPTPLLSEPMKIIHECFHWALAFLPRPLRTIGIDYIVKCTTTCHTLMDRLHICICGHPSQATHCQVIIHLYRSIWPNALTGFDLMDMSPCSSSRTWRNRHCLPCRARSVASLSLRLATSASATWTFSSTLITNIASQGIPALGTKMI
jgi:hypothetical protein